MMDTRRLDWTLLRSFLAVIDAGSLIGAARILGTYQPTLSRQITELESQLGASLFERTGRGLVPTAAGRAIVDAAREVAEAVDGIVTTLAGTRAATRGSVRLSCSQVAATYLMPSLLSQLRRQHPQIQIELSASNAVSNLLRREADIALRLLRPSQTSLVARKLADMPMGAYAARGVFEGAPRTAASK
jgi:DNA-binding transcriptional LysR family regulator